METSSHAEWESNDDDSGGWMNYGLEITYLVVSVFHEVATLGATALTGGVLLTGDSRIDAAEASQATS